MLKLTGSAILGIGASWSPRFSVSAAAPPTFNGLVFGEPTAAEIGNKVLANGGNAIDAVVAAALAAAVVGPHRCGIGGYGGHMTIALRGGRKITAIDFNSAAPAAATANMFPLDENGKVRGQINEYGWLAAGVPGTLAGLHFVLDRYGTRRFREVVAPAMRLAEEGFSVNEGFARAIRATADQLRKDPGAAKLFFKDGAPLEPGDKFRNPDLAEMLGQLADENSVQSFYRGEIARRIVKAFANGGGIVTAKDLEGYHAREVKPLECSWDKFKVCTAPLTAGGLTMLEALNVLRELGWGTHRPEPEATHAFVEALRLVWRDRLQLLGDPEQAKVPIGQLLSSSYAEKLASQVQQAARDRKPLPLKTESHNHRGTTHLNAVDKDGNVVALTLTHGNAFGACVTVEGLGLVLGHGMSRFTPEPGHPNSPGPRKRPLHNMCPTIVLRDGKPVFALGATGGRMIPNAITNVLACHIGQTTSPDASVAAPRVHTEGDTKITVETKWPEEHVAYLRQVGYTLQSGSSAIVQAIFRDEQSGVWRGVAR